MRSSFALVATAFVFACADAPTVPLQQAGSPSFDLGKAPPPWALIQGELTTDGTGEILASVSMSRIGGDGALMSHSGSNTVVYRAWLLVTPGGQVAMLRFVETGTNVTFSSDAMIRNVKGKVSGQGTMIVGGHTYDLGAVTQFEADADCALAAWDVSGPSCASFSAGDESFSSEGSVWTGVLANDGEAMEAVPACAATADFVVTTAAGLSAALTAVTPGGTIAIDGLIEVSAPVLVQADDIRLTCKTLGSGITSSSATSPFTLLHVAGNGVQVDNLVLSSEPSTTVGGALHTIFANNGPNPVERLRLRLNRIRCGNNGTCAFLVGAPGALVTENLVESLGTASGIHVQGGGGLSLTVFTDNTIVERNNMVAPGASTSPLFGAIRVRDGRGLIVRYNATSGIWRNGIALAELDGLLIEDNFIRQPTEHGILASTNPIAPVSLRNSIIRNNRIDGPQLVGIRLNRACSNRIENNEITIIGSALRARFEPTTGANVYVGNSTGVLDQGSFDCDGDGFTDPNKISGSTGPSTSTAGAARNPTGSLRSSRSAVQSGSMIYPELQ